MKGYDPAFAKLAYGDKADVDPFKDINPKIFLTSSVMKLSSDSSSIAALIQSLPQKTLLTLQTYVSEVGKTN